MAKKHLATLTGPVKVPNSSSETSLSTATLPITMAKGGSEQVTEYLSANPDFLESFVINNVDLETVERWVIRKARLQQKDNKGNDLLLNR